MAYFNDFPPKDKINFIKTELVNLIKSVFENPILLKNYVVDKKISNDEAKQIFNQVNNFNSKPCSCCRRFDPAKVKMNPINFALEPLLDIAQETAKTRRY